MNSEFLALIAILLYLAGAVAITLRLLRGRLGWEPPRGLGIVLGLGGALFQGLVLYGTVFTDAGLNLGFFNAAAMIAWTIVLLLMISSLGKPVENLGIPLLPLAALAIALDLAYPSHLTLEQATTWDLRIHILVSLLGYSLLALASVQAVLLAMQDHQLRHRHPGGFVRALPPLQTMEALLFEMIGAGFILLSLSLVTGFVFLEDMFAQRLAHKTILSIAAWLVFGTLLWGRLRFGWRGRTALIWTLSGFVVLMLAYFGSKAVIELILV